VYFKLEQDETWAMNLIKAEDESPTPLSAIEHTHMMAMTMDNMGTLRPTTLVSNPKFSDSRNIF